MYNRNRDAGIFFRINETKDASVKMQALRVSGDLF
jgi:hypothetical protein